MHNNNGKMNYDYYCSYW